MGKKILIIDDEKDFTELMSTLLEFHDFKVDAFTDSADVQKAVEKTKYDLVMTDLMMPHLSGFDVIHLLRQMDAYKTVPIIALSAKTLNDKERKILLQNKVYYVMKPFEPQGLVEQIRQMQGEG
ncbi:MAG: response regulator [Deltaproteobacteria bacterium]|nr:response regulator [Deltaproteobacteria bacterium]